MIDFINNINLIYKNWTPSKEWESELRKNEKIDKVLIKKYPPSPDEKKYAKQYGNVVINVIDKLDQESIDKSTDALIAINTIFSLPTLLAPFIGGLGGYLTSKASKNLQNQKKISIFNGALIGSGIYFILREFISSQLEKETTRIARFQTRNNELKDISNFIINTQEKNNKNEFSQSKISKDSTTSKLSAVETYKNAFNTLKEMKKNYKQYKEWKNNLKIKETKAKEKLENIQFTTEELNKAQKDRNKLINTIYKLELASNNEEINFQFAIDLVQFAAKISGATLATLLCLTIPQKTAKIKAQSNLVKYTKLLIPFAIPTFSLYLTAILAKFQKDSAKLGRYEKKKELASNKENFITFEDSKRKQINLSNDSQEDKNLVKNIINDIKSIKTMPKRLNEMYSSYKLPQEQAFDTNIKYSNKQIKDAELLQKQLFYTFEKIDEKSEGFSDDVDVILKTIKTGIGTAVNVFFNIYALNLLTQKLKDFNNQKIPNFFEGLKLMKNLERKDMIGIFVVPYVIKTIICLVLDSLLASCRKKTNKVGVMTAINELKDEKLYTPEYLQNFIL